MENNLEEKKTCRKCAEEKDISEFRKSAGRLCKPCEAEDLRSRFGTVEKKLFVYQYLQENSCVDCGETNPVVLQFDHRDPSSKKSSISHLISRSNKSLNFLKEEISKCDVRCANCHHIKTAKDRNWDIYKWYYGEEEVLEG